MQQAFREGNMGQMKEVTILVAEDDDGHAFLIEEGLTESGLCNNIIRFSDGQEAWEFLLSKKDGSERDDKSYLLLLDINMPRMDGIEVLKRIKKHEVLCDIPVIMLTTTDDPREIELCYKIGCNFYITKPVDFIKLSNVLKRLGFFIQIVTVVN
jgi:CheY-like chemotaxis protein